MRNWFLTKKFVALVAKKTRRIKHNQNFRQQGLGVRLTALRGNYASDLLLALREQALKFLNNRKPMP